jgi:nickel/cobalt transporter (NicO) family protein
VTSGPAIVVAAAGVGFGHAVLPDHWLPLATVGRTQRYPLPKLARLSVLAGVAHVLVSLLCGAALVAIGLSLRSHIEHAENAIVGGLLVATGLAVLLIASRQRREHEHRHSHEHPHAHEHPHRHRSRLLAVAVPFGAAASPDLTILPVFIAASASGALAAILCLVVFAIVTIATFLTATLLAGAGAMQLREGAIDRWGNLATAAILVLIGGLVLAGLL